MKNDYEIRGEITAIFMNSNLHGKVETLISTTMLDKVKEFPNTWGPKWNFTKTSLYVYGNLPRESGKRKGIFLHRWITDAPDDMVIDHINHNTLDNREINIRLVTQAQNNQNLIRPKSNNKSSGILGVYWDKESKKWLGMIGINGKYIKTGRFKEKSDAEISVKEARKKYMPFSYEASMKGETN